MVRNAGRTDGICNSATGTVQRKNGKVHLCDSEVKMRRLLKVNIQEWTTKFEIRKLNESDIDAVYKLKASLQPLLSSTTLENITRAVPVECIINLTERLTAPTVTFDIKVPNADTDIQNAVANLLNNQQSITTQFMYLLVSGSFYSDSSTSSNIGATASATTGFELLSNQLSYCMGM